MPAKIYWLHNFNTISKLGIMARPRGNEWLEEEILSLKKQGVGIIVSLLDRNEIYELGLEQEPDLCLSHGIEYINLPIVDRNVPSLDSGFYNFIGQLKETIIAGCLLLKPGYKTEEVITHISKIRGLRVPDTDEQIAWLKKQES
jgi:hypothetical protein